MFVVPLAQALAPVQLAERLAHLPGLCFLDGEAAHRDGRFSFVGAQPVERLEVSLVQAEPLAALSALEPRVLEPAGAASSEFAPRAVPRWVGYIAYDACWAGKSVRLSRPGDRPALCFARYDALAVYDHGRGRAALVGDDRAACERLRERLAAGEGSTARARVSAAGVAPAAQHRAAIEAALDQIARGQVYQVNLARCYEARLEGHPLALFRALRAASPVPFGAYFDDGRRVLLARSMERFLRWERAARTLETRPIKGTLARSGRHDREEAAALRADPKERAEHAMIVDLMRNDLGRIAEIGSVCLPEVMAVEPFAKLSHLVSTVRCRTRPELGLSELLAATFPPGSVTGTPKLRAIELIEELETEARDAYTGAIGFVDREGGLSLAVAIRTAIVEQGRVRYFAGGGIVEASRVERELEETELKAQVLRDAIESLRRENRDFRLELRAREQGFEPR